MPYRTRIVLITFIVHIAAAQLTVAGDWPQILGPNRDCVADGETLRHDWGNDRPKELWQRDVGDGLSGVAVAGGRMVLYHRLEDEQVVEAMAADTGKVLWTYRWPTYFQGTINPDSGPRCVPLIDGDAVYLHGAAGNLVCLSMTDGKRRWLRDTFADFDVRQGYFGVGSTPLVAGDLLLVNVGGRKEGGIVAFALADGKTVWQLAGEQASYSSPKLVEHGGTVHAMFVTRYNFLSLDPQTGTERFRLPFGKRGPTVNGATPIVKADHVFLSASYGIGSQWIEFGKDQAKVVKSWDNLMSSQYATCVFSDEVLYGLDGRQDGPPGRLRCFTPSDGSLQWSEDGFGMATLIRAGEALLVMKTDGELVLVEASPAKYRELGRWQLLSGTARALPALSDGRFFVRDEKTLKCFELGVAAK